jgi:hypothetical protein
VLRPRLYNSRVEGRPNVSPQGRWSVASTALTAIVVALLITACGSSQPSSHTTASSYSKLIRYSDCMRSNGVPNFPDPEDGGYPLRTSGINMQSPAFQSAQKVCLKLQPGGKGPSQITGAQLYEMAEKARCIRRHGFSNFPDPTLAPGGHGIVNGPPADWNMMAPAAIKARKACNTVGIVIPGWGVEGWAGSL